MVGFYKIISKEGIEEDITVEKIESDKDIYNFYYKNQKIRKKNINIPNINFSPIYRGEDLKKFYWLKDIIEGNIKQKLQIEEIKTPNIIRKNMEIEKLQKLFGLDDFACNKENVLSPASDFGVFTMFKDKNFQNKEIPNRVYEFATCYRVEEKEKDALKRPTSFYLPDIHCFLSEDVYGEVLAHLNIYESILRRLEIPYFVSLRIAKKEYDEHKNIICNIAKELKKQIIVNIVPESIKYWETKFKYIYKNSNNEFVQLSTVQVDYNTAKIFNIKVEGEYVDIVHSSIGSMERLLYALWDKVL